MLGRWSFLSYGGEVWSREQVFWCPFLEEEKEEGILDYGA